jgi:hypothetical protein
MAYTKIKCCELQQCELTVRNKGKRKGIVVRGPLSGRSIFICGQCAAVLGMRPDAQLPTADVIAETFRNYKAMLKQEWRALTRNYKEQRIRLFELAVRQTGTVAAASRALGVDRRGVYDTVIRRKGMLYESN